MKKSIYAICLVLFVMILPNHSFANGIPTVGAQAPAFKLPNQENHQTSLGDFSGKWVVLYFYPKDMSNTCSIEAHIFQSDLPKYEKQNAVILGVSVDSVESHKEFCTKDGLDFKLLADTDHSVSDSYGSVKEHDGKIVAARNTFLIDPRGIIRKVYTNVDVSDHSQNILADLVKLQSSDSK